MAEEIKDIGASVRARLLRIAQQKTQTFDLVLTRYAIERLLYRLAQSSHALVLKGAMLLMAWFDEPFRGSRDLDLLGRGDPDPQSVIKDFREILGMEYRDGVRFDVDRARMDRIREDNEYGGFRIRTTAGIGGAIEPGIEMLDYPVLLDMPVPRLRGYAPETVVAEKFQAIVALGRANSRMKDYYDLWMLNRYFDFEMSRLAKAISATFARRGTRIPEETPDGLTLAFAKDVRKSRQWDAFKRDITLDPGSLAEVIVVLEKFLMSAAKAARDGTH